MGVYQLPSAQKNEVKCRLLLLAGQNVHVKTELTCLFGALSLVLKSWGTLRRRTSFQPGSLLQRDIFQIHRRVNMQSFPKSYSPCIQGVFFYLFLPPSDCGNPQNQVGRKKINLVDSKQKSGFILRVFASSHSPFFPSVACAASTDDYPDTSE